MDLTSLSTKEPGKNENINAGSGGNQAVCGGKGGGGWESEVAARMQGGLRDDEEEGFGSSWDRGGWGDEEAGEFDCGGWARYS